MFGGVGMTNGTTDVPDTVPGPRWKTWKAEASAGAHRLAFQVRSMLPATPRSSPGRPPCELGLCICPMPPTLGCFALVCPSHGLPWIGFMLQRMFFFALATVLPWPVSLWSTGVDSTVVLDYIAFRPVCRSYDACPSLCKMEVLGCLNLHHDDPAKPIRCSCRIVPLDHVSSSSVVGEQEGVVRPFHDLNFSGFGVRPHGLEGLRGVLAAIYPCMRLGVGADPALPYDATCVHLFGCLGACRVARSREGKTASQGSA